MNKMKNKKREELVREYVPIYDTVAKVRIPSGQLPVIVYIKDKNGNYKEICLNPDTHCHTKKGRF